MAIVVEKLDQLQAGGKGSDVVVVVAGGVGGAAGATLGGAFAWVVVVEVVAAVDDVVDRICGFVTGSLGAADLEA